MLSDITNNLLTVLYMETSICRCLGSLRPLLLSDDTWGDTAVRFIPIY